MSPAGLPIPPHRHSKERVKRRPQTKTTMQLLLMHPDKMRYGPVVGFFQFFREKACRQFPVSPVVVEAFTAPALFFTGFVCAVAVFFELCLYAFHKPVLPKWSDYKLYLLHFRICNGMLHCYFPMQKSLNILFSISSAVTAPTISPSLSSASLSSSAVISMG